MESYVSVGWLIYRETGPQGVTQLLSASVSFPARGKKKNKDGFPLTF